ncbi:hypothetical protein MGYG_02342 [Nannizzia gypsea CBS 118893]|uniref:Uncharacterized protein n=1 Tax=Arthroderma gypseum (strain ATCC MYA-4604 / CBS 118893) TaxID=535722 RepID=E4UR54_ARTGP|nr:hypothetical protein MGYG_02342 [Nannizzia gypsea CBS 118893]EFQ99329.1 hypothetical protein MGYG_02342 [Nannizzia gypsea CBS 118893]
MGAAEDEWLQALVARITSDLHIVLNETGETTALSSVNDLDEYFNQPFSLDSKLLTHENRKVLDEVGTEAWNRCNKGLSNSQAIHKTETLEIMGKYYGRLFKAGLKTADRMIGLARKVFEKLDRHNSGVSSSQSAKSHELAAECSFQLSILVWKDRLEGLGISQQPIPFAIQSLSWKAKAAEILLRVGMAKKRNGDQAAIEWLQCCYDFSFIPNHVEEAGERLKSLRRAVLHELTYLDLQQTSAVYVEHIQNLYKELEERYGSEPSTRFLGFEVSFALVPHVEDGVTHCGRRLQSLIDSELAESHLSR